jgi:hypothetical protein
LDVTCRLLYRCKKLEATFEFAIFFYHSDDLNIPQLLLLLPTSASGFSLWLPLLASAAGFRCWLPLLASAAGFRC